MRLIKSCSQVGEGLEIISKHLVHTRENNWGSLNDSYKNGNL